MVTFLKIRAKQVLNNEQMFGSINWQLGGVAQ